MPHLPFMEAHNIAGLESRSTPVPSLGSDFISCLSFLSLLRPDSSLGLEIRFDLASTDPPLRGSSHLHARAACSELDTAALPSGNQLGVSHALTQPRCLRGERSMLEAFPFGLLRAAGQRLLTCHLSFNTKKYLFALIGCRTARSWRNEVGSHAGEIGPDAFGPASYLADVVPPLAWTLNWSPWRRWQPRYAAIPCPDLVNLVAQSRSHIDLSYSGPSREIMTAVRRRNSRLFYVT